MQINFDNDFQQKIMTQTFATPTTLATPADVQQWRAAWMGALSSWHSPYKALVDCAALTVADTDDVRKALDVMVKFFNGFFLRKVVGFGLDPAKGHSVLPFPVHVTEDEAAIDVGLRQAKTREPTDFRSTIHLQNHFQQHTVELNFTVPVVLETKEQMTILKSKLMNNLMQWHSKWSLIVDCTNLEFGPDPAIHEDFKRLTTVLRGFFMKEIIGYSPKGAKDSYPFDVYRARHRAAAILEGEGNFSGDKADCKSRKTT
jgi:hypothetical protein